MRYYSFILIFIFTIFGSRSVNIIFNEVDVNIIRLIKTIVIAFPILYLLKYYDKNDLNYIFFIFFSALLALIFSNNNLFWLQIIIIGISAKVFSSHIINKNYIFINYFFISILLIVLFIDYLINNADFIYTSYYNRSKLLLGFNHPKILSELLLFIFLLNNLNNKDNRIINIIIFIFIYFIDSRNSLLFIINLYIINYFLNDKNKFLTFAYLLIIFINLLSLSIIDPVLLNKLMSGRLYELYRHSEINLFSGSLDTYIGEKTPYLNYYTDNSILDLIIKIGLFPTFVIILYLVNFIIKLSNISLGSLNSSAVLISYLIYCLNDSALFSSGNIFNYLIFSILALSLNKYYEKNINSR